MEGVFQPSRTFIRVIIPVTKVLRVYLLRTSGSHLNHPHCPLTPMEEDMEAPVKAATAVQGEQVPFPADLAVKTNCSRIL
jgi:hypothetical protein